MKGFVVKLKSMNTNNFLAYKFPNAGQFYSDSNCLKPLFIGQIEIIKNKIYIKVLSTESYLHYCNRTLYARFSSDSELTKLVSYTFFDCKLSGDPFTKYIIEFSSFISHDNGNFYGSASELLKNKAALPNFIEQNDTFKKISFQIDKLDKWLWRLSLDEELDDRKLKQSEFAAEYVDNKGEIHKGYMTFKGYDKSITKMQIPFKSLKKTIKLNDDTSLTIYSEPNAIGSLFPDFSVNQISYIEIKTRTPKPFLFFARIIAKTQKYLSILTNSECKIHRIYNFTPRTIKKQEYHDIEFYDNRLVWDLEQTEQDAWHVSYNMTYRKIKKDFAESIKNFFNKYDKLHLMINFILDSDRVYRSNYLELYISSQIQLIEIYGNLNSKKKDNDTKNNIKFPFSILSDRAFDLIFLHHYKTRNSIPCSDIFGETSKTKEVDHAEVCRFRTIITDNLMHLRNFITHPCSKGKFKEIKKANIYPFWCCQETNGLNLQAISYLSASFNKMIRFLILKEIGLENYFYKENE